MGTLAGAGGQGSCQGGAGQGRQDGGTQGTQKVGFVSRAAWKYSPSFHMLRDSQKGYT